VPAQVFLLLIVLMSHLVASVVLLESVILEVRISTLVLAVNLSILPKLWHTVHSPVNLSDATKLWGINSLDTWTDKVYVGGGEFYRQIMP